jgi:hypothetical protein
MYLIFDQNKTKFQILTYLPKCDWMGKTNHLMLLFPLNTPARTDWRTRLSRGENECKNREVYQEGDEFAKGVILLQCITVSHSPCVLISSLFLWEGPATQGNGGSVQPKYWNREFLPVTKIKLWTGRGETAYILRVHTPVLNLQRTNTLLHEFH